MQIDLTRVPFSAAGAYLCVTDIRKEVWHSFTGAEGLYLRTTRDGRGAPANALARIELNAEPAIDCTPGMLRLRAPGGEVRMVFDEKGRLRIAGDLLLTLALPAGLFDEFLAYDADCAFITSFRSNCKLVFRRLAGDMEVADPGLEATDQSKRVRMSGERWELLIEEFPQVYAPSPVVGTLEGCALARAAEFGAYFGSISGVPERYRAAAEQAAYLNYTAQVGPAGMLEARVMLMSKNWMNRVWTWDCAFNAVAVADFDSESAWNNLVTPFRRQPLSGMLPDTVGDRDTIETYTKPPIHGWALRHLRAAGALTDERRAWFYPRLKSWVESWYKYMDWDGDGMCQYNHGNDSGWDNCTNFLVGAPIEGPDLAAYLVICFDELARLADELNLPAEAAAHRARADRQLKDLIEQCWDGEKFRVAQSGTHRTFDDCDSLFPYLPILLGERLPKAVFKKLADGLKEEGRFLTPYGLATERVGDRHYRSDGYWRGPIWAPPMMFIVEGLARGGELSFARELATRFCDNCAVQGFAENFDAATGAALRDRAYTWTSSVFLILIRKLLGETPTLIDA